MPYPTKSGTTMAQNIHPTAIIAPGAILGENVSVGPYSCIGSSVILEDDVTIMSHVVIEGRTRLGSHCTVFPFASLGHPPQDLKYQGEDSCVEIGSHTVIREYVTIQPGTLSDRMKTSVGNHCLLMAGVHIAHDCTLGNHVILANYATLGGHVQVGDYTIIGGLAAIHQFVRIGAHVMISGTAGVADDVIPFSSVSGRRAKLGGLNLMGLSRRDFSKQDLHALRKAYRHLFLHPKNPQDTCLENKPTLNLEGRLALMDPEWMKVSLVQDLVTFLKEQSHRSLCLPRLDQDDRMEDI
jgi:UDP-N-acetylglucosamine acyltransferase